MTELNERNMWPVRPTTIMRKALNEAAKRNETPLRFVLHPDFRGALLAEVGAKWGKDLISGKREEDRFASVPISESYKKGTNSLLTTRGSVWLWEVM